MRKQTIVQFLATTLQAIEYCEQKGMKKARDQHDERFEKVMRDTAPSGSGIDAGTKFFGHRMERGGVVTKIAFEVGFHHMDENGFYDGWTHHQVVVWPTFDGISVAVTGRDRNDIKEYLREVYYNWLTSEAPELPWDNTA